MLPTSLENFQLKPFRATMSGEMVSPDQNLIKRFLAGESEAVRTIDEWIMKAAFSYKIRLAHVWDDVLQTVRLEITRLLQNGAFRGESSLKTYLWRVVNSTCLTFIRKQLKAETVEIETIFEKADESSISPLDAVLQKETESLAMRVWAEMPSDCRELWKMILKGLSYDEMSREKHINSGTLRVRVLRCREKAVIVRDKICQNSLR
jgi:RNA polymerase sigma factor (sigma-70 family)